MIGKLVLPREYAGKVLIAKPAGNLYRVTPEGHVACIGAEAIHLSSSAANSPFFLFDAKTILQAGARPLLKVFNHKLNGPAVLSAAFSETVMAPRPVSYSQKPPSPEHHLQLPQEFIGRLLILKSSRSVFAVVEDGYLLSWGCGVYLGKSGPLNGGFFEFADIHDPQNVIFPVSAGNSS